jgi:hypothetical protein
LGILAEAIIFGGSNAIERMEARGQSELVSQSTRLPTDGILGKEAQWEDLGIKIGEVDERDPMFVEVELPEGWELKPSDHSMWSYLHDEKGRKRAGVFYKAASYDRSAHIHAERRYSLHPECENDDAQWGDRKWFGVVVDKATEEIIFTGPVLEGDDGYDSARKDAVKWLNENRPDWENSAAYWD